MQRATLLNDLVKVQASPAELEQYVSLTSLQNKGLKRHFRELETSEKLKRKEDDEEKAKEESDLMKRKRNSIKGSRKKIRLGILDTVEQRRLDLIQRAKSDPNKVCNFKVSLKQQWKL